MINKFKIALAKEGSLAHKLIKSFMGVGVMFALAIPISFFTNILLARTLGPDSFGQYTFVMAMLALISLPVTGGLSQLLTREVAGFFHDKDWGHYLGVVRSSYVWVLLAFTIVLVTYYIVGPILNLLPVDDKFKYLSIVLILVPLQGLNAVRNGTIKGLGFPVQSEMPTKIIQPVFLLVALSILYIVDMLTIENALWAQALVALLTFFIATLLFLRLAPKLRVNIKPEFQIKSWFIALLPFALLSLVGTFNTQLGILLLGLLGSNEAVAVLQVAERVAQFVALPLTLVNMIISPYIVKAYKEGNPKHLQKLSRQSSRGALLIALIIGVTLILFGDNVIYLAFGEPYAANSYLPMVILITGYLLNTAFGSVGLLLAMSGCERITLYGQFFGLLLTVILALILIPTYYAVGVAIAALFGQVAKNAILGCAVVKYLKRKRGIL